MKSSRALTVAALSTVGLALTIPTVGMAAPRPCKTSLQTFKREARAVYTGTDLPPVGSYAKLRRMVSCQDTYVHRLDARAYWRLEHHRWAVRRRALPPLQDAVASYYDAAGGPIACGGDSYAIGVANKTLPCGTRLEICYSRCSEAVVFDRGPYVPGRSIDLSVAAGQAIGFPFGSGVATIHYRILH